MAGRACCSNPGMGRNASRAPRHLRHAGRGCNSSRSSSSRAGSPRATIRRRKKGKADAHAAPPPPFREEIKGAVTRVRIVQPRRPLAPSRRHHAQSRFQPPRRFLRCASVRQAQGIELDEAFRVAVVIGDGAFLEGHQILIVERERAGAADDDDVALVELEADLAGERKIPGSCRIKDPAAIRARGRTRSRYRSAPHSAGISSSLRCAAPRSRVIDSMARDAP